MSVIGSYQLFELPLTLLSEKLRLRGQQRRAYAHHLSQLHGVPIPAIWAWGSAVGWVVAVIIFTISLIQIRLGRIAEED